MEKLTKDKENNSTPGKRSGCLNVVVIIFLVVLLISGSVGLYNDDMYFFYNGRGRNGGPIMHFHGTSAVILYMALLTFIFYIVSAFFNLFYKNDRIKRARMFIGALIVGTILLLIACIIA